MPRYAVALTTPRAGHLYATTRIAIPFSTDTEVSGRNQSKPTSVDDAVLELHRRLLHLVPREERSVIAHSFRIADKYRLNTHSVSMADFLEQYLENYFKLKDSYFELNQSQL